MDTAAAFLRILNFILQARLSGSNQHVEKNVSGILRALRAMKVSVCIVECSTTLY